MLVICPLRPAYTVWPHQKDKYQQFEGLRVKVLHGPSKDAALTSEADIYVMNPEGLRWLGKKLSGKEMRGYFDMLVVDESTQFKDTSTIRFKALREILPCFKRRYILTGTMVPAGLLNMFGQVYILDQGQSLGRYITRFREEYFTQPPWDDFKWIPQPDAEERLVEKLKPLVHRISPKEITGLPELVVNDVWVDLPASVRKIYTPVEEDFIAQLEDGNILAANAAVAAGKCRQIANGRVLDAEGKVRHLHNEKIDALCDLVEQLQGEPLLLTYEYVADRDAILEALGPGVCVLATGNAAKDAASVQQFSRGSVPVAIGMTRSIALGIDGLQNSCYNVAMLGTTWSLADYMQVVDRVRRSGNKSNTVYLHRILARDTVDSRVLKVLDERATTQETFLTKLEMA